MQVGLGFELQHSGTEEPECRCLEGMNANALTFRLVR